MSTDKGGLQNVQYIYTIFGPSPNTIDGWAEVKTTWISSSNRKNIFNLLCAVFNLVCL